MNDNYDFKKYGADKIAFLGMFLIAILIAQLLVSMKSGLDFSEPIELEHTGLSISIPTGKGWEAAKEWKYVEKDDEYTLRSNYSTYQGILDAAVNCRYFLNTQNEKPKTLIESQTNDPNNIIAETKIIKKDNLEIYWANFKRPFNIYLGVAELPNNRTITIEVVETSIGIEIAEKIFTTIIDNLNYNEDNLVETGLNFVKEIKNEGLGSQLNNFDSQSCFFIQDSNKSNIGFTIDFLANIKNDEQFTIRGASETFWSGRNPQERKTLFRCDNGLNKYIWQIRVNMRNFQTGATITLDESGVITFVNQTSGRSRQYLNCSNVIPNTLLELLIKPAIQKNISDMVIDIIDSNGQISPTRLSIKPASSTEDYSHILTLQSLFSDESPETFYLNENNRIIRADGNYNLDRTDIATIEKEFPGMSEYISEQMQILNSNSI